MRGLRVAAVAAAFFAIGAGSAGAATGPAVSGSGTWDNGGINSFSFEASGLERDATGTIEVTQGGGTIAAHVTCLSVGANDATVVGVIDASPVAAGGAGAVGNDVTLYVSDGRFAAFYGAPTSGLCFPAPQFEAVEFPVSGGGITLSGGDPTPPEVTPVITGRLGDNGWYTSDVSVDWSVVDPESGSAMLVQCPSGGLTADAGNTWLDCRAVSSGGVTTQSVVIRRDATRPTLRGEPTTLPGPYGWWNHDVTIRWTCSDNLSGVVSCPAPDTVGEGTGELVRETIRDRAGNSVSSAWNLFIDETKPTIAATPDRAANDNGWYDAPVTVGFACGDALSGIASCSAPVTLGEGVDQSVSGTAVDKAQNTASTTLGGLNVDLTAPTLTVAGNAGTYTVADTVAISCTANDALSGLAGTTCADVNGPAWQFGLGTFTKTIEATDRAGNVATSTVSFTVTVDAASLDTLIARLVGDADVAAALQGKVDSIASAPNANAKAGKLAAFDRQIDAQTGKAVDASTAALLKQLAAAL